MCPLLAMFLLDLVLNFPASFRVVSPNTSVVWYLDRVVCSRPYRLSINA